MISLQFMPGWQIMLLPVFLVLGIITALGSGILISALNVKYRDFRVIIPFVLQLAMYVSPVAFSSNSVYNSQTIPTYLKFIYSLNPAVGVIDGFRWCITGGEIKVNLFGFTISVIISIILLITGIAYFRKTEKNFADYI
jgi:lipopolysaccharide transport system permease protein